MDSGPSAPVPVLSHDTGFELDNSFALIARANHDGTTGLFVGAATARP